MERVKLKVDLKKKDRRGGLRPGGGRPKGSANKATNEIRQRAAAAGELPHEFALRICRSKMGDEIAGHKLTWDDIRWAAYLAAPFYGSKLHTSTWTGPPQKVWNINPKDLLNLSEAELAKLERILAGGQVASTDSAAPGKTPTVNEEEYAASLN